MEAKKTVRADLTRKSTLFFSLSLMISLGLVITAFEWKTDGEGDVVVDRPPVWLDDSFDPRVTEIKPPEPPKVMNPKIELVEDDQPATKIPNINIDLAPLDPLSPVFAVPEPVEDEPDDVPVVVAEVSASPQGGLDEFYKYVAEKMNGKYPAQARRMGIQGRVFVEFVVNRDGSLVDVRVIKGIGGGCDELAEKVLREAPAWNPGKQRGKPVRQRMVIPITFKLG